MARFTDALRGDGLARTHRALGVLEQDPLRLKGLRSRSSRSPSPSFSDTLGAATTPGNLTAPNEQRLVQLRMERLASLPYKQFSAQIDGERKRLWDATLYPTHLYLSMAP